MKRKSLSFLAAIPCLLAGLCPSRAATIVWSSTASGGGNVSDGANWVGGVAPAAGDALQFNIPVAGGTRTVNNDLPAGTALTGITFNGAAFTLAGNSINLSGSVNNNLGSPTALNTPLVLQSDVTFNTASSTRIDNNGTISGSFGIIKTGVGTLRLQTGGRTYTGDTTVSTGTLDLNVANALPSGAGVGNVMVASGATLGVRFGQVINGLSGAGAMSALSSGTKFINLGNGDASGNFSGVISNGSGAVAITKSGAGTQILSGTNTYTGATAVNGGTLLINGNQSSATGTTTVATAATLGGIGTVGGSVTQNGKLAPGAATGSAVGTLTFGNSLVMSGSSLVVLDLNGNDTTVGGGVNDLLVGTNITLSGSLEINPLAPFTGLSSGIWRLMNYSGTLSGTMALGTMPATDPGTSFSLDTSTPGQVNLVLAPVPEVSAAILSGMASLALLGRRRRRPAAQ